MNPIEFIFSVMARFWELEPNKLKGLQKEAENWYDNVLQTIKVAGYNVGEKIKEYSETWWLKVILGLFSFIAIKWMRDFMNEVSEIPNKRSSVEDDEIYD